MAKIVGKPSAEDVKRVAVAALVAALDDGKENARKNPRLTGVRAVATGAVLYTAGKAALNGRRFIAEHLRGDGQEPEDDEGFEDDDDYDEADGEPVAEEDEDFEEDEEPEEEPVAEEDEDFEEDEDIEEDEDDRSAASEPPVHPDEDDIDDADLPERPSRKRTPVGRR
jgi:hypothetical protein